MPKCENCYHKKVCALEGNCETERDIALIEMYCKDFKDKDLIFELPCKIGDTVYYIKLLHDGKYTREIKEDIVRSFEFAGIDTFAIIRYNHAFSCDDFSKTVFLSREEAEKAFKESGTTVNTCKVVVRK